jgi:hypothetical protein
MFGWGFIDWRGLADFLPDYFRRVWRRGWWMRKLLLRFVRRGPRLVLGGGQVCLVRPEYLVLLF